jgi:hypothetical protein
MKNKALMYVGIAVLGYVAYKYFYKKPKKDDGKVIAPPPTTKPPLDLKPQMSLNPNNAPKNTSNCPSKEQLASARYSAEGMADLKARGCI